MSKIRKSWEDEYRNGEIHSPHGIKKLRETVRAGLRRQYYNIAVTMFEYRGITEGRFEAMSDMSQDTAPECWLLKNGSCAWFELGDGSIHTLPYTMEGGINMYGKPNAWRVIPEGWNSANPSANPREFVELNSVVHTREDSVLMTDDLSLGSPKAFIDSMVDMLVDNIATVNQLQLIAKCPFVFNSTQENLLSAKNYFLALSNDEPVIFRNSGPDAPVPQVELMNVKIDPALFEIADRVECYICEFLGIPCVPITKRAQQSVAEVESTGPEIDLRRTNRFNARKRAIERVNRVFGTSLEVVSVLDEAMEEQENEEKDNEDNPGGVGGDADGDPGETDGRKAQ